MSSNVNQRAAVTADRLVGIGDAATAFGVSEATVRRLVRAGKLDAVRLVHGGRLRFRVSELEQVINPKEDS